MAFLDFIKNRNQQQPVAEKSQEQKPENAKQMYTREAAEQKAAEKPITPEVKAQADKAMGTMREFQQQGSPSQPSVSEGSSPNAHLQKQDYQDKAQHALSPTDGAAGKTASQEKTKAPEKQTERPQTIARRPPSWER
jgi:hypothetical protein